MENQSNISRNTKKGDHIKVSVGEYVGQRKKTSEVHSLIDNRPQADQGTPFENPIQRRPNNTGLPDNLKTGIENLSGHSMDDVKVHYNSPKPAQLQAHAYAQGTNIHLGSGQEKHLAHEAWHIVQQKQGRVQPTMQMKGMVNINDDDGLEKEADVMGAKALQMKVANKKITISTINSTTVQRTTHVNVGKSQKLVKDVPGGKLGGITFGWQSIFDVDIINGKVLVIIKIESSVPPELFNTVWAPQVDNQWSNRFMIKANGVNYPIEVQLLHVVSGGHYNVKAVGAESAMDSGSRGHFGTQSMTEWGIHDSTNVAHEVGHMLGNVDEYGIIEDGSETNDYLANPSDSIMAVSKNNPIAKHYSLIKQAADEELAKKGLSGSSASEVLPDISSRHKTSTSMGMHEILAGASKLKPSASRPSKEIKKEPPVSELSNVLSRLKSVPKRENKEEVPPQLSEASSLAVKAEDIDRSIMNKNLEAAKLKLKEHPESWVVERLVTYIEQTIAEYDSKTASRSWCVTATGKFLKDIDQAIKEKHKEGSRPEFMD